YDPMQPVLCMDEQPVQLLKETRVPIAANQRHAKRVDYEYERAGTANIFMFAEPLAGWPDVAVRQTKTKVDWAVEMASLMEGRYARVERVTVVCDNLNTHTKGAFYESFAPARARQLVRRSGLSRQIRQHYRLWIKPELLALRLGHRSSSPRADRSHQHRAYGPATRSGRALSSLNG